MLRTIVLVAAMLAFTIALIGAMMSPGAWPMLIVTGIVLAGILFERGRYGAARPRPLGPGWQATPERFVDEASGRVMTVWFNTDTGERRYVDAEMDAIAPANELQ